MSGPSRAQVRVAAPVDHHHDRVDLYVLDLALAQLELELLDRDLLRVEQVDDVVEDRDAIAWLEVALHEGMAAIAGHVALEILEASDVRKLPREAHGDVVGIADCPGDRDRSGRQAEQTVRIRGLV